jgi:hypothetical protein
MDSSPSLDDRELTALLPITQASEPAARPLSAQLLGRFAGVDFGTLIE